MSNGNKRNMNTRAINALHPLLQRKQKEMFKGYKNTHWNKQTDKE